MAVEHIPEHTLTLHRFCRSGDLWKHALPKLRRMPIAHVVFDLKGIQLEWTDGDYRVPMACPHCEAVTLTRDDTLAVVYRGGGVRAPSLANCRPNTISCEACGQHVDALEWLADWKPKALDRLLTHGPFRGFVPGPESFIVAAVDGKFSIGRTVKEALDPMLGPVFDFTQRLSRIAAMGPEHAGALVDEHHAAIPWKDVEITPDLEPVDPAWHGGPLAPWEQQMLRRRAREAEKQAREALDRDVAAFRRRRASELRV